MSGFDNETMYANNYDFRGVQPVLPQATVAGVLPIGTGATPAILAGSITSPNSSVTIGYSSPNITIVAGATVATTYTTDSGVASPSANNLNVLGSGSITTTGAGNTVTTTLQGLTNHAVLIGAGTSTITKVGPVASTGNVLMSNGLASDPGFSTATYPAIATGTGTILRADGTNWVATTATYPATTTSQQILYSTANNVIGELTTANSRLPATNSAGTLAMRAFSVVIQTFTSGGTYTPTSGMLYCQIEVVGSGAGGGGSSATAAGTLSYGAGGGSGEYARGVFSAATIGVNQTVTVPAGGAGGTAGNNAGTAGGTTSVGALISAGGGQGGGGGAAAVTGASTGGTAGTGGSGGSFRFAGTVGQSAFWSVGVVTIAAKGATGMFSGGTVSGATTASGATGTGFGGGGGGGRSFVSSAAQAGGPGSSGLVVITEYVIA